MPIYAYKCASCGHAKDVLRRMSDDPLTVCPACGASTFEKQVTAAGFQLKGSGWYVTDFRGGNTSSAEPAVKGTDSAAPASSGDSAPAPKPDATAPNPAPAPAPAAAASTKPSTPST
ncbi:FmdB family zinc ribbon protein [Hydrogenophaga crassostreae]|uniref:FmdB family zinc ribbon protein n=1 Tax=Hydrogenophaga crassostreae TaxID=1763535 RepID=UPI0009EE1D07|nr:FmdB family zinc ribbon protein [Hydrogenophaga crassostreae]